MAKVGTVKVKIKPDLSEFKTQLIQELALDDPLAKLILAASQEFPRDVSVTVWVDTPAGRTAFKLDKWTLTMSTSVRRMQTSWRPAGGSIGSRIPPTTGLLPRSAP